MRTSWIAIGLAALLLSGCSENGTNNDGEDGGGGGGNCSASACDAAGVSCGSWTETCGTVSCGKCQFTASEVTHDGQQPSMVSTPAGLVLAYSANTTVTVSRQTSSMYLSEFVATGPYAGSDSLPLGLAVNASGTVFVAYTADSQVSLATSTGTSGPYTPEVIGPGKAPEVVLDSAGKPHVAYVSGSTVKHAYKVGSAWQIDDVDTVAGGSPARPSFVSGPNDSLHLLIQVGGSGSTAAVRYAVNTGSGFTVETLEQNTGVTGSAGTPTALTFDAQGNLHALWVKSPSTLVYGLRKGTTWTTSVVSAGKATRSNALTLDAQGHPVVAYYNGSNLILAQKAGSTWAQEPLNTCDEGGIDLAYDTAGILNIAHTCGGLTVLSLAGKYSAEYEASCDRIAKQMCEQGCACGASEQNPDQCCVYSDNLSNSTCTNNIACYAKVYERFCGDITQDPAQIKACDEELSTLTCTTAVSTPGVKMGQWCSIPFM